MKNRKFRIKSKFPVAFAFALLACAAFAHADAYLGANDLEPAALKAPLAVDSFTLIATEAKGVTVEALDVERVAADGEVFNVRIKLNGSGSAEYRAVKFAASAAGKVVVYLNSSSKTDARVLKLVDAAGNAVAELQAPPDAGTDAGMASADIPAAGDYYLFSAGSGINLYAVSVE